ncbi:MAG: hypothetical protein K0S25_27 [Bacillus sp. (in: firmicutes)]|nr:hypothetical protein [Bacillus sp. (in: firmicutes)]
MLEWEVIRLLDKRNLVLIEKTTNILGKNTKHMPLIAVIEGLVEVIEKNSLPEGKKANYLDLDDE